MKRSHSSHGVSAWRLALAIAGFGVSSAAMGATNIYWDGSASSGFQGADGNWNSTNWNTNSSGNGTLTGWSVNDGSYNPNFGSGGSNNVTVSSAILFSSLLVNNANTSVTISSGSTGSLSGTSVMNKTASGVFDLAGGTLNLAANSGGTQLLNWMPSTGGAGTIRISGGSLVAGTTTTPIDLRVQYGALDVTGGSIKSSVLGISDSNAKTVTFTMSSGAITATDIRLGSGAGASAGGTLTATQTGGAITASGRIMMGSAPVATSTAATVSYSLSGTAADHVGLLQATDLYIYTKNNANVTNTTSFTLGQYGKLLISGTVGATDSSKGWLASANSFSFSGGTLAAGTFNTAAYNGDTLSNAGGMLAPGDVGKSGKSVVNGNYVMTGANSALAIDIAGNVAATAFDGNAGTYDVLATTGYNRTDYDSNNNPVVTAVAGNITLGGQLFVNLLSYTPTSTDTFTIVSAAGAISGSFTNVDANGWLTLDNGGRFAVTYGAKTVTLSQYSVPEPASVAILGLAGVALLNLPRRRRNA